MEVKVRDDNRGEGDESDGGDEEEEEKEVFCNEEEIM